MAARDIERAQHDIDQALLALGQAVLNGLAAVAMTYLERQVVTRGRR